MSVNPLEFSGNYSVTSNSMKLVHWPLMGELLHLVQRGGGLGGVTARPGPSLFSSIRDRQLLNCLALRLPIGPNALPLINKKPNDKGEGPYPP